MRKALVLAALPLALAACGGASGSGHSRYVSRSQYGSSWPLKVSKGTLGCTDPDEVTFTKPNGAVYWVNGLAGDAASENGWLNIRPIWANDPTTPGLKKDIGVLIDDGLKLCQ
jgi:Protein of unknown function (DUF2511)